MAVESTSTLDRVVSRVFWAARSKPIDPAILQLNHITHVLIIGSDAKAVYPDEHLKITIIPTRVDSEDDKTQDHTGNLAWIREAVSFLSNTVRDPNSSVVLDCSTGTRLSGSVLLAFLISHYTMSYEDAYEHVASIRSIDIPENLAAQLRQVDTTNQTNITDPEKVTKVLTSLQKSLDHYRHELYRQRRQMKQKLHRATREIQELTAEKEGLEKEVQSLQRQADTTLDSTRLCKAPDQCTIS